MGAIPVSAREGYALWADTWDATPSPIVALERRALLPWISELRPRRTIDVGCGSGAANSQAMRPELVNPSVKKAIGRLEAAFSTMLVIWPADGDWKLFCSVNTFAADVCRICALAKGG